LLLPAAVQAQFYDYKTTVSGSPLMGTELKFAQLLWKSSKRVGCARKFCQLDIIGDDEDASDPEEFTACFFYPGGNVDGQFKTNVLPLLPPKRPPPPKCRPPPPKRRPPPPKKAGL
jgi:hypothetical protein